MKINLNDPNDFTMENVAKLIASKDDSQHCQLRVSSDGYAYLSDIIGNRETDYLAFRLESFCAGNDYVGEKAGQDLKYVEKIYNCLSDNWPDPIKSYIDIY